MAAPLFLLPSPASATLGGGSPFNALDAAKDANSGPAHPDKPTGSSDDAYTGAGGGAKEDDLCPTVETGSIPNNKADLTNFYAATGKGTSHTFLYLAWTRASDSGTVTLDFELNQSGEVITSGGCNNGVNHVRTAGKDRLITYDVQGSKDATQIVISIRTWDGSKWGDPTVLDSSSSEGSISDDLLFGEMAIDLEAAGLFTEGACDNFASVFLKSRSSNSFDSAMKDFIAGVPQSVSNCGSLTVTKTVVGGAAGDTFGFTVDCGDIDDSFSLSNNGSHTIDDIPLGSQCSVSETDPGASKWTTTYTVAGGAAQSGLTASGIGIALGNKTVAFTNTRKTGDLIVSKVTTGGSGTFTFHVDCDGTAYDQDVTISNSGSKTIHDIPTDTSCTVTEVSDPLFTSTRLPANGTVTIDTNGETVSFTNVRNVGDLTITKATSGGTGTFTFHVNCDGSDFDQDVTITDSGSKTIHDIPTGTSCTVTEVADPLFSSTSQPSNGTVIIDSNGETVSFTNVRKVGDLTIDKLTTGGSGTFTFNVNCDGSAFDQDVTITDSGSKTIRDIPTGTSCTVNEVVDPQFTSTREPSDGTVTIDTDGETVSFLNVRKTAGLTISKLTSGGSGTFTFDIDCDGTAFDKAVSITNSGSYTLTGIPTGTRCKVTERENGLFTSSSLPSDGEVTIDNDGETVAFTNVRNTGGLTVSKETTGGGFGTFTFHVDCDGEDFDQDVTITNNGSRTITGIPTETSCTVTEEANVLFSSSVLPADGQVTIDGDGETVAFTNATKPNGISIDKKVNGVDTSSGDPLDVEVGSQLSYTVKITNSGQVPLSISQLSDSLNADLDDSCEAIGTTLQPGGSITCTYTMTAADPGGASIIHNTASVAGVDVFERSAGPVDDETFVHVLNPAIRLDKTGPGSAHVGDTITYTLTVTNPGNTPLDIIGWDDDVCDAGPVLKTKQGEDDLLDQGETWAYQCSHVVVAGDPDQLVNTATVTGADKLETEVDSTDDATTSILRPAIAITKSGATTAHVGDAVVYTLVVTNPGNTPLASVTVSDPKCDGPPVRSGTDADGLLSPGEAWTYHCTHVATAADGASILNTAKAEGTDPLGQTVTNTANHSAVVLHPAISIVKTANPEAVSVSGSVTYIYVVTNTGDAVLHDVLVTDDILGAIGSVGQLAPGESVTLTKTVDVDASTPPRNIGTAVGTDPLGQTVSATDDAIITVVLAEVLQQPELPRTGAPLQTETRAALALLEVGIVLTLAGRRRRARRAD